MPRRPSTRPCLRDTTCKELARLSRSFDNVWDETEVRALVQFVLLMCQPDKWPTHKRMVFWNNAGKFVQNCTKTLHLRSGEYYWYIDTLIICTCGIQTTEELENLKIAKSMQAGD